MTSKQLVFRNNSFRLEFVCFIGTKNFIVYNRQSSSLDKKKNPLLDADVFSLHFMMKERKHVESLKIYRIEFKQNGSFAIFFTLGKERH